MDIEKIREYCLQKKAVTEGFPFDNETLVFKVAGKIFAILPLEKRETINLKCDPDRAIELRELHEEIRPGWHMNKKHWNTVSLGGGLSGPLIRELIDHSYQCVIKGLPKKVRDELTE